MDPVATAISKGLLKDQVIMQTHGGRARSIETGELVIDIAFIGLSCADKNGNGMVNTAEMHFGPVGYSNADMMYAKNVVVITDNLVDEVKKMKFNLNMLIMFSPVVVDSIGKQESIVSGTTQITKRSNRNQNCQRHN